MLDEQVVASRMSKQIAPDKLGKDLCKALTIAGLVVYLVYIFVFSQLFVSSTKFWKTYLVFNQQNEMDPRSETNISHIVFGIAGSSSGWKERRALVEAWWRPNITRGILFLDRAPKEHLPWSASSPPYRVSEDVGKIKEYNIHPRPDLVRMLRVILETFREINEGVRWYIRADDDTIFNIDNLLEVLRRYDHNKYYYIGQNSEDVVLNKDFSFNMAFGGAGCALSFPLAKALAKNLDICIKRYPNLRVSDQMLQSCVSDLGVTLTHERGFHQIDLLGDVSGMLSAHPQVPFVSFHHLSHVDPIFPSMDRYQSLNHLMKAVNVDPSRSLQQTICYYKESNWSFSISWGYSAQIYENIHPPSYLEKPLLTFSPWKPSRNPRFMFNVRPLSIDPCQVPHSFFYNSTEQADGSHIVISYMRRSPRNLPNCLSSGNHSADSIMKVRVYSPNTRLNWVNLSNANLEGALTTGNTSFKGSVITGADFTDVPLRDDQKEYLCKIADGVNPTTGNPTKETLLCN